MALLVGIDEAGYGPHIGPLVVAGAAIEFDGPSAPDPDLWAALEEWASRRPAVGERGERVVIGDSKAVFSSGRRKRGLAALERTVLGFLSAAGLRPGTFAELLTAARVDTAEGVPSPPPWHFPHQLFLPHHATMEAVDCAAGLLSDGLASIGGRAARLWICPASAGHFNRLLDGGRRNKAQVLFLLAAGVLSAARAFRPADRVRVAMDRHGGRRYYADLLAGAFPMHRVRALEESPSRSRYSVDGGPADAAPLHLTVCDRCETRSLPTALASMAAKYVRERCMDEFNAYFASRSPGLKPTAGYGLDARRFLEQTAAARAEAEMPLEIVLRLR